MVAVMVAVDASAVAAVSVAAVGMRAVVHRSCRGGGVIPRRGGHAGGGHAGGGVMRGKNSSAEPNRCPHPARPGRTRNI